MHTVPDLLERVDGWFGRLVVHARHKRVCDGKMSDSVMYGQRLDEIGELMRENQALKLKLSEVRDQLVELSAMLGSNPDIEKVK